MNNYQKYSGAGNKFIMVNNLDNIISEKEKTVLEIMSEEGNQSFDGVIFIEKSSIADYHMNYFNKDGTGNALCGNGLRCTVRYIQDNEISSDKNLKIEAVSNIYKSLIKDDGQIQVYFPPPVLMKLNFKLKVHFVEWWQELNVSYMDVGSPHIVVFIDDIRNPEIKSLEEVNIIEWGRNLRMHKDLMPAGANVNFIRTFADDYHNIEIRSYERGVEGETLACGTGAISSAIVACAGRNFIPPVKLLTRSGEYLTVDFNINNGKIENLSLTGNAVRVD